MTDDALPRTPPPGWAERTEEIRDHDREYTAIWEEIEGVENRLEFLAARVRTLTESVERGFARVSDDNRQMQQTLDYIADQLLPMRSKKRKTT